MIISINRDVHRVKIDCRHKFMRRVALVDLRALVGWPYSSQYLTSCWPVDLSPSDTLDWVRAHM